MLTSSKIYIAGHKGLVGSAITRSLLEKGYTNLILKTQEELDLTDQMFVDTFFSRELPEYVILAAAKVGGIHANNKYRADFIYNNLIIQSNVIHSAWKHGVKKLIFLGSTCIYPKNAPQPLMEDCLLSSPLEHTNEPYAIAKIAGLKMCESYNIQYKTNFISVMPTNLYGIGDNFDLEKSHVLPALLRKLHLGKCLEKEYWDLIRKDLDNRPIGNISGKSEINSIIESLEKLGVSYQKDSKANSISGYLPDPQSGRKNVIVKVWGTGRPLREFMNSQDMAEACVYILENIDVRDILDYHLSVNKSQDYHPPHFINIGTGEEISIKEVAFKLKEITGFKGEIVFDTSMPDGTMRKVTDNSALRKLGFTHKIDLNSGLKSWYNHYLNSQTSH